MLPLSENNFDADDPRFRLTGNAPKSPLPLMFAPPQLIAFSDTTAEHSSHGTRSWYVRMQHAVIAYSLAAPGETWQLGQDFTEAPLSSEVLLALPDLGTEIGITAAGTSHLVSGPSVTVIPAGPATVEVCRGGVVIRVHTDDALDLVERCANREHYATLPPNVAQHQSEPGPNGLLSYDLDDYPPSESRFGSIFQSRNLMVNFITTRHGPRDVRKLSPHSHADFEQCSLQIEGEFTHHVRTPWTPNLTTWRPDLHLDLVGPGAVIFPPPLVHTSQATGAGDNRLIDIFAPPRRDFLAKSGWVLNADDFVP